MGRCASYTSCIVILSPPQAERDIIAANKRIKEMIFFMCFPFFSCAIEGHHFKTIYKHGNTKMGAKRRHQAECLPKSKPQKAGGEFILWLAVFYDAAIAYRVIVIADNSFILLSFSRSPNSV